MNPDLEDPNNHVPAVTPDDAWDDIEELSDSQQPGLPPKRVEQGLPPKKESRSPRVNRLGSVSKPEREGQGDPIVPSGGGAGSEGENEPAERRLPAGHAKVSAGGKRKRSAGRGKGLPPEEPGVSGQEEPSDGDFAIPEAQPAKRLKVNQIGSASQPPAARLEIHTIAKISADMAGEANSNHQNKKRRYSRGERSEWGDKDGSGSMKWMLYTGLGVFFLVILAVALSQLIGRDGGGDGELPIYGELAEPEGESSDSLKELELLTNSAEEAKAIFAAYAGAKVPGDLVDLVHAPERNREVIAGNWKPLATKPGWKPGDDSLWTVIDRGESRFGILKLALPDFTEFRAYFRQGESGLRLDWKATVGYATADFDGMKKGKGDGSEVRALVSVSDFYTYSFPEEKFSNYRIMSPDGGSNIWGYLPVGGELEQELLKLFLPSPVTGESEGECQLTLSIEPGNGDSLPDQWLITGIKRRDWLDE